MASAASLRTWLLRIALVLIVWYPALSMQREVAAKAVDVGAWDMWENAPLMAKWNAGTLSWSDLYAAQIQHRIVVPRLLIIGLTNLSGGDFRYEQFFTFGIFCLDSLLIWLLLCRTLGRSPWRWPIMLAANLMIFCPMHYQIVFWGASMWATLPMPCLLGILLALCPAQPVRGWGLIWRVALSLFLAEIATHSFGHGLAIWPLLIVLLLVSTHLGSLRVRGALVTLAGAVAAVTILCYFTNFINIAYHAYNLNPGDHAMKAGSSLLENGNWKIAIAFMFAFVGSWFSRTPFVSHPLEAAQSLGIATLVLVTACSAWAILSRSGRGQWRQALPWLALAAYVIGVGLMLSKRAADMGEHRSITPRYLAVSQYLLISLSALLALQGGSWWRMVIERFRQPSLAYLSGPTAAALLAAYMTAQIPVWQYGQHLSDIWYHARRQAQATLLFLPAFQGQSQLISMKTLCKGYDYCLESVNILQKMDRLKTRPLESPDLKWLTKDKKVMTPEKADVTHMTYRPDGTLQLEGHGRFNVGDAVDAILITDGSKVIALGQPTPRPLLRIYGLDYEFSNTDEVPIGPMYPWKALVPTDSLAEGAKLQLWALNVATRRVTPLQSELEIHKTSQGVTKVKR